MNRYEWGLGIGWYGISTETCRTLDELNCIEYVHWLLQHREGSKDSNLPMFVFATNTIGFSLLIKSINTAHTTCVFHNRRWTWYNCQASILHFSTYFMNLTDAKGCWKDEYRFCILPLNITYVILCTPLEFTSRYTFFWARRDRSFWFYLTVAVALIPSSNKSSKSVWLVK